MVTLYSLFMRLLDILECKQHSSLVVPKMKDVVHSEQWMAHTYDSKTFSETVISIRFIRLCCFRNKGIRVWLESKYLYVPRPKEEEKGFSLLHIHWNSTVTAYYHFTCTRL